jgi:hypothetical protein
MKNSYIITVVRRLNNTIQHCAGNEGEIRLRRYTILKAREMKKDVTSFITKFPRLIAPSVMA